MNTAIFKTENTVFQFELKKVKECLGIIDTEDSTEGVNALSSIPHKDVMKMVAELREGQKECDPNDPETMNLFNEFSSFFKNDNVGTIN